jgi:hypothetical protein
MRALVFVILAGFALWPAGPPAAQTASSQKAEGMQVYFEVSYTNYAWGYMHNGIFIDPQGDVYEFMYKRGDKPWRPKESRSVSPQELEDKYSHNRKLIRKIPAEELLVRHALVPAAAKGTTSKAVNTGYDAGARTFGFYLFDPAAGRYKKTVLDTQGDFSSENLAPEARELLKWLKSVTGR